MAARTFDQTSQRSRDAQHEFLQCRTDDRPGANSDVHDTIANPIGLRSNCMPDMQPHSPSHDMQQTTVVEE
eukprot:109451-Prymnesium_polylepis.2